MTVGVDEIAWNVLAQGGRGRARQAEVHGSRPPERDLRPADHCSGLEAVAGQEPLRGKHVEGVEVVVSLGIASRPPGGALEPLHEPVAAAEQRFVLGVEGALALTPDVEAPNLLHRPPEAPAQTRDHGLQTVSECLDVGAERCWLRHAGVRVRPPLPEHPEHASGQVLGVAPHEIAERAQVERRGPQSGPIEQVRSHPRRQTAREHVADLVPLRLRATTVASISVETRDDRRMGVLGDHRLVA